MAEFPSKAKVVVIGLGGIVGASVVHHLIERGWDDIVGIDKSGIPTDIGSTAHASDFCYMTSHDFLSCWTSLYSLDFYDRMGHYERIGGLEVARVGDDARMDEIKRKVASAKAFGTRARLIDPAEIKEKFPLIEESMVQGGLWDPDAGLVIPRSQTVAGKLVDQGVAAGKLKAFANTSATSLIIDNGRITRIRAEAGQQAVEAALAAGGDAAMRFREFGLGFNPKLIPAAGSAIMPYYGYGAGVVRLSLGDNEELGGNVRGGFTRWFFFPDATVHVDGKYLVRDGRLE